MLVAVLAAMPAIDSSGRVAGFCSKTIRLTPSAVSTSTSLASCVRGHGQLPISRSALSSMSMTTIWPLALCSVVTLGRTLERVPADRLEGRLAALYAARPADHVLYLKADRDADYARVLTALDAARRAGVRRIGAITEQARDPRR